MSVSYRAQQVTQQIPCGWRCDGCGVEIQDSGEFSRDWVEILETSNFPEVGPEIHHFCGAGCFVEFAQDRQDDNKPGSWVIKVRDIGNLVKY